MPKYTDRDQGTLFDAPSGPARKTEWADVEAPMRPNSPTTMPPALEHPSSFKSPGRAEQLVRSHWSAPHEKPLAMLHSAREIMAGWSPAEGDRLYHGTNKYANMGPPPTSPKTGKRAVPETDTQMWSRKGREAKMGAKTYRQVQIDSAIANGMLSHADIPRIKPLTHTTSLVTHLRRTGGDMPSIPLAHHRNPNQPGNKRPMVAGGQHRIAAMAHINPDQLLPVTHHETIMDARKEKGYT